MIEQSTLDNLTPPILRLLAASRDPITVFIDSPGGSVFHANMLHKLISAVDQDFSARCRLITVATGFAASAASDLLMAGDYALAYPHCMILCHGVREATSADMLTHERAVDLAKSLASTNEQFALQLARNSISRFIFRFLWLRSGFDSIREQQEKPNLTELQCFIHVLEIHSLEGRISSSLIELLSNALKQSLDNDDLDNFVTSFLHTQGNIQELRPAEFAALLLRALVNYEVEQHKEEHNWSFHAGGFEKIEEKFLLLIDKHAERHTSQIQSLSDLWGRYFLTSQEEAELATIPAEQRSGWILRKVQIHLQPIWFFFVSMCRRLQEDDYYLSAEEGYWLGLIDEVIGREDLPSPRILVEYARPADSEI